jgi:phasin family protein
MSQSNNNPFFPQGGDFSKFLPQGTGIDLKAVNEYWQNQSQAGSEIVHTLIQGMQDLSKRTAEIISELAQEQAKSAKDAMGEGSPEQKIASSAQSAQKIYEKAVGNLREIADLAQSVNGEVADILNKRISASLGEIKSMAEKTAKSTGGNKKAA